MLTLLLLAVCGVRHSITTSEPPQRVDRIEINSVYFDSWGQQLNNPMRQLIAWRWHDDLGEYHVSEWFMLDESSPELVRTRTGWRWKYRGAIDGKPHWIESDELVYTKTDHDVERIDQNRLPVSMRLRLIGMVHRETWPSPCPVPGEVIGEAVSP